MAAKIIGISLIAFEITKPFIYIYGFDRPWQTFLPLHMCNFSAVLIGIFLLTKKKDQMFFELPFYWGIGGATMALITPDLDYAWPDIEYFMFFYGHGQIVLGIFFALAVLKYRPYLQNFLKMAAISLLLLIPIYSLAYRANNNQTNNEGIKPLPFSYPNRQLSEFVIIPEQVY